MMERQNNPLTKTAYKSIFLKGHTNLVHNIITINGGHTLCTTSGNRTTKQEKDDSVYITKNLFHITSISIHATASTLKRL